MASKKGMNNEDFAEHLRDQLKTSYPEYRFCVNAYSSISGSDKHSMQGYHYVKIFRKHGRNLVVSYTKKSKSVPNSSTLKAIETRIVNAIKNKVSLFFAYQSPNTLKELILVTVTLLEIYKKHCKIMASHVD